MEKYIRKVLSEEYAKEICGWKYENEYSVYNFLTGINLSKMTGTL